MASDGADVDLALREPPQQEVAGGVLTGDGGEADEAAERGVGVGGAGGLAADVDGGGGRGGDLGPQLGVHLPLRLPLDGLGQGLAQGGEDGDAGGSGDAERRALLAGLPDAAEVDGDEAADERLL